jgi:LasA protease
MSKTLGSMAQARSRQRAQDQAVIRESPGFLRMRTGGWSVERVVSILAIALLALLLVACSREKDSTPVSEVTNDPGRAETASTRATVPAVIEATGLSDVGSLPEPTPPPQVYIVQPGDTLTAIAQRYGCDLDALIQANNITDPNTLQVGQKLEVPSTQIETGPAIRLLPNSEFVNSPAYLNFDVTAFCSEQGGYLATYQENVDGKVLSGPEIVELVVHHYSVGPRMLLAVLELKSGWVTNPNPSGQALSYPMGYTSAGWDSLHQQLAWAANSLNEGYYNWRGRGMPLKNWGDGTASRYAPTLNAATAGLQYFFSLNTRKSTWEVLVGSGSSSFLETYRKLFGDPDHYAIEPLIPAGTTCPTLSLPWSQGEMWFYTSGPHGGWGDGSAWAAIDAVPDEGYLGCQVARSWTTAAAPGLIIYSQDGEVMVDLDGDGHEQTGWVLFYLHIASEGRVAVGTRVKTGDPIGHPSCEGGFGNATHLHFARKYNGEWIAADGPLPLVLSGWQFHSSGISYEGTATRGGEERTRCECSRPEYNGLSADR